MTPNSDRRTDVSGAPSPALWRATGLAFLVVSLPAVLIGAVETTLTLRAFTPSVLELLYGANVHLLVACVSVVVSRVLLWKIADRAFVPAAAAAYALVELSFTAAFWILKMSWVPRLSSAPGKLFAAGTVVVLMLAGARLSVVSSLPPHLYSCRVGPWKLISRRRSTGTHRPSL